jgi:hypothetical protein
MLKKLGIFPDYPFRFSRVVSFPAIKSTINELWAAKKSIISEDENPEPQ